MAVVEGRLQMRDWTDKDGNRRTSAEVVADNVYFADSRRDGDGDRGGSYGAAPGYGGGSYGDRGGYGSRPPADYGVPTGGDQFAELADDDGDLPF
jgi:single-strand DNA-binding protein